MKRCPACRTIYAHGGEFCAIDGSTLETFGVQAKHAFAESVDLPVEHTTLDVGSDVPPDSQPTVPVGPAGFDNSGEMAARLVTESGATDRALIGKVIADRYRIDEIIGRGGMGVVYRARHLLLEREVAVKLLLSRHLADDKAAQRFFREAQTMARVEHPNAVAVFDFGVLDDGAAYIVMELIDGETLRARLCRVSRLGVDNAVAIAAQVCAAVDAAHRHGVVHRDLKPENIMFKTGDSGSLVKVVDFGLAKLGDVPAEGGEPILTLAGELFGTPAYMAPEYYESEPIGAAADIYSLGVIVYEMLAGFPPFRGTIKSVVSGHLFKEPPPIGSIDEVIPDTVKLAVTRALSKDPAARFSSAAEFAEALTSPAVAVDGEPPPRLDTLRMSRDEVGLPYENTNEPDTAEPEQTVDEPPPTESMDSAALSAVSSTGQARVHPAVIGVAVGSAVLLAGMLVAGALIQPLQQVTDPAPGPATQSESATTSGTDGQPGEPEISGRPQVETDARRAAPTPRDKSRQTDARMEISPVPDDPAPEPKSAEPVATTATPEPAAKADKKPDNTNVAKNTAAKPPKETKKKKRWWNPASWF